MTADQIAHAKYLATLKAILIPESTVDNYKNQHIENMKKYGNIFVYGKYYRESDDDTDYI